MLRRIIKILYIVLIFIFILLLSAYFLLRSNYFLENYIFPAVTTATGIKIKAENIIFQPILSSIELSEFNININPEFNIQGKTISIEYGFWSFLKGNIDINKLILDKAILNVKTKNLKNEQTRNINLNETLKLTNSFFDSVIAVRDFHVKDSTANIEFLNSREVDSLKLFVNKINIDIQKFTPYSDSEVKYSADFKVINNDKIDIKGGIHNGLVNCQLLENMIPSTIISNMTINNITGFIRGVYLNNRTMTMKLLLDFNGNFIDIKTFELKDISKVDELIANINIKSKIVLDPFKADIDILKCSISPEFLNLFGSLSELNFNRTHLNYHGKLIYSYDSICSDGILSLANFSYSTLGFNPFDNNIFNISLKHDFCIEKLQKKFDINTLLLSVYEHNNESQSSDKQNNYKNSDPFLKNTSFNDENATDKQMINGKLVGNKIVDLALSEPFSYLWSDKKLSFESKAPSVVLQFLNFKMNNFANIFARYFGVQYIAGLLNSKILMTADNNCNIKVTGNTVVSNLNLITENNVLNDIEIDNRLSLDIRKFSNININKFNTSLSIKGKKVTDTVIKGAYDILSNDGDLDLFIPFINKNCISLLSQEIKSIDKSRNFGVLLDQCSLKLSNKIKLDISRKLIILDYLAIELYKQTKRVAYFSFKDPFVINYDNWSNKIIQPVYSGELEISDMKLSDLNCLFKIRNEIEILSGRLNAILHCDINMMENKIKTFGDIGIDDLDFMLGNKRYKKIELKQNIDVEFNSLKNLVLNNVKLDLLIEDELALSGEVKGCIDFTNSLGSLKSNIKNYSAEVINKLPIYILQDILCIKTMLCAGTVIFDYTDNMDTFRVDCKLKGTDLTFFELKHSKPNPLISGDIDFNVTRAKSQLIINSFDCNLYIPKGVLSSIKAEGKLIFADNEGKSKLNITSNGIMLKEFLEIFYSLRGEFKGVLKEADFDSNLSLKNITYGQYLNLDCTAYVDFANGFMKAEPIKLTFNDSAIHGQFFYDFKPDKNNYFNIWAIASDVNINPILKIFHSRIYSNSKGVISHLLMMIEGRGLTEISLDKNFKGMLKAKVKDVSIPDNKDNFDYIRLLFLPIEMLSQMSNFFTNTNLPQFFITLINYSNSIFYDMRNLQLEKGVIELESKNGRIYIDKCLFKGDGNQLEQMNFKGSIGFDESINLYIILKLNKFVEIPFHITGSVSNPQPDYFSTAMSITENILKPVDATIESSFFITIDVVDETGILIQSTIP